MKRVWNDAYRKVRMTEAEINQYLNFLDNIDPKEDRIRILEDFSNGIITEEETENELSKLLISFYENAKQTFFYGTGNYPRLEFEKE